MTAKDDEVTVLVTGASGFVGKNLCTVLHERPGLRLIEFDVEDRSEALTRAIPEARVIVHLAGVNRPQDPAEFAKVNAGLTRELCRALMAAGRSTKIILASSTQVERDNPYGASKRAAEDEIKEYCAETGAEAVVFRFKNLFGKWCRPNYNSVTATFCHNIAHDLPIQISDPAAVVDLTYVDDAVMALVAEIGEVRQPGFRIAEPLPSHRISLADLAQTIEGFRAHRRTLVLPDYEGAFTRALYATYLSYLEPDQLAYRLDAKSDPRGTLAEFVKSSHFGQIFVSRTKPGITRGNHYHHTKTEKFMVVQGEGIIRLRQIHSDAVIEHRIAGADYRVVDIPPGYTHSIENVGSEEMVTLFWSSEVFDPTRPDTQGLSVLGAMAGSSPS